MKAKYNKDFWARLRQELKTQQESLGSWDSVGAQIGAKGNTLLSFYLGRAKTLSQETLEKLHILGIDVPKLIQETTKERAKPIEWNGQTKSVKEASQDKGYSEATIRKYCKEGRIDYVQNGKRGIAVVENEKYQALPETEKAQLRKQVATLKKENEALRKENEELKSGQVFFSFMEGKKETKPELAKHEADQQNKIRDNEEENICLFPLEKLQQKQDMHKAQSEVLRAVE